MICFNRDGEEKECGGGEEGDDRGEDLRGISEMGEETGGGEKADHGKPVCS